MKINWKQKLSSRKFWALITALVLSIIAFCNLNENTVGQIGSMVMAFGSVCVYTLSEASVDKARVKEEYYLEEEEYENDN